MDIVPLKFQVLGLEAQVGYQLFSHVQYMYLHVTKYGKQVKILKK